MYRYCVWIILAIGKSLLVVTLVDIKTFLPWFVKYFMKNDLLFLGVLFRNLIHVIDLMMS
jgi:hypothetical protein